MNTRHLSRWFWPTLAGLCLAVPFISNPAAAKRISTQPQDASAKPTIETAGGLTVISFTVNPGTIKVNLPDDIRAGDTISGTVVAEPKGDSKGERATNGEKLEGLVVMIRDKRVPVRSYQAFMITLPGMTPSGAVVTPDPKITTTPGMTPSGAVITPDPKITPPPANLDPAAFRPSFFDVFVELGPPGGGSSARATIPVRPLGQQPGMTPSGAVITPDPKITPPPDPFAPKFFDVPLLGQTGRPVVFTGPFDGNSSNTHLDWGYPGVSTADGMTPEERDKSGLYNIPLAESPRKAVFQSPNTLTGSTQVTLKEGSSETKSSYRNVGVNLSAPKTNLIKGEKTTLTVQVNGLDGLKQPVPLTITYRGVIVMEGGPYQPLVIQPSQVSGDGRYTTTRGITGVQTGGWTATATVVTHPFDFCLQDDSNPARMILWNTFTGDYNFICPGCLPTSGGVKTSEAAQIGDTTSTALSGTGTMTRKGCIITLTHNAPDRRIFSRLDVCTDSGSSTVEAPKTGKKLTITDRNTADNTCACGPGCK